VSYGRRTVRMSTASNFQRPSSQNFASTSSANSAACFDDIHQFCWGALLARHVQIGAP
jgi:hypothetical protein